MIFPRLLKLLKALYQLLSAVCVILILMLFYADSPIYTHRFAFEIRPVVQAPEKPVCGSCRYAPRRITSPFK